jgi:hypothetical protein
MELQDGEGSIGDDYGWPLPAYFGESMLAYATRLNLDIPKLESVHGTVREMESTTYVNRVKTSDKPQKAVLDFIKA